MAPSFEKVMDFWFKELEPIDWYRQNDDVDELIKKRFGPLHQMAAQCEISHWRRDIKGRLAEIIVLDQFSRNLFRGSSKSFATDGMALALSQEALMQPDIELLTAGEKAFCLMPFMHSESAVIHEQAVKLFSEPGMESNLDFELKHKKVIDQFGRYPHRNEVLGRESTAAELTYLASGNAGF